jgi:hypothetical protein
MVDKGPKIYYFRILIPRYLIFKLKDAMGARVCHIPELVRLFLQFDVVSSLTRPRSTYLTYFLPTQS